MTNPGKNFGLLIAVVSKRDDPKGLGRIKFTLPTHGHRESDWTRVLSLYGGAGGGGHGSQWVPEVKDEVVIAYINGNPQDPIVIGSIFSDKQKPPSSDPDERIFKTKKGHTVTISDVSGSEKVEIATKSGQKVTIDEQSKTITVKSTTKVVVDAPQVHLGGDNAMHPALLADEFLKLYALHTHPVVLAATGPPVPTPLVSAISTTTKLKG